MGRRSTDLEQPIRDWQNICIIATQNDLIDLSGDFEYTMYDLLVEELLQEVMQTVKLLYKIFWMNRSPRKESAGCSVRFF